MTSLSDRPSTALLVVDMQQAVVAEAVALDEVMSNINTLVDQARAADVPVVWIQHADEHLVSGSDGWKITPGLTPADGEPLVHKTYGDSFEATDLEAVLAEQQVGHVVVTGAQSDACIRSTLHGALVRGYDVTLATDAHTTEDLQPWGSPISPEQAIAHVNQYWQHTGAPGRTCRALPTAEISL